jgi:hypothetical protein
MILAIDLVEEFALYGLVFALLEMRVLESSPLPGGEAALLPLPCDVRQIRETAANTTKPYILDDASTLEYQRLDLMSRILDPWARGYLSALGVGRGWRCLELGSGHLDAATLDAASALLEDPNYWTQCRMMTAVWARKSPA